MQVVYVNEFYIFSKMDRQTSSEADQPAIISLSPSKVRSLSRRCPHHMTVLLQVPGIEEISSKDAGVLWQIADRDMEIPTLL